MTMTKLRRTPLKACSDKLVEPCCLFQFSVHWGHTLLQKRRLVHVRYRKYDEEMHASKLSLGLKDSL